MKKWTSGLVIFSFLPGLVAVGVSLKPKTFAAQEGSGAGVATGTQEPELPPYRPTTHDSHRFWDRTNLFLFAGVGTARVLDYNSTRYFRARGPNEILLSNAIVDSKPFFIGVETAGTAASIALAYWLHKAGHHRLERWLSIGHVGVGVFGSVRNYHLGQKLLIHADSR